MKKRLGLLIVFGVMLIGAVACKKSAMTTEPAENKATGNIPAESGEIEVERREYGTEEAFLEGNKLEGLTETGADYEFYCNLEENIKMECSADETPVLVCKDPVYDITYYVNYGRDYYIYAYREEKAELAVAIPARDLFCKEGELYFIADSYGLYQFSGFAQGNVLKYNPKDGTVAVVSDCNADRMIVYTDGICYKQIESVKEFEGGQSVSEKCFFFSFATKETTPFPQKVDKLRRWNGNLLQVQNEISEISESDPIVQYALSLGYTVAGVGGGVEAIDLVDIQGNVEGSLQNVKGIPKEYWICNGSVYYVEHGNKTEGADGRYVLKQYDMKTGKHKDVTLLDYPIELSFSDMIWENGTIYFKGGFRVALDNGTQCYMLNADGSSVRPEYFYTDGEYLFCLSNEKLWLFEEQQGASMATQEFIPGIPLEMGTYRYRLYEPRQ